jgi:hypothetical protein
LQHYNISDAFGLYTDINNQLLCTVEIDSRGIILIPKFGDPEKAILIDNETKLPTEVPNPYHKSGPSDDDGGVLETELAPAL